MGKQDEQLLLSLALQIGLHGKLSTSTAKISASFGGSQQTISRKLRRLKAAGLILLEATPSGCSLSLTKKGIELLNQRFLSLKLLFEPGKRASLSGTVKDGLGEGRYYVSRPPYLKEFRERLGFKPFFGTLNLTVEPAILRQFLAGKQPIEVPGFTTEERSFGKIKAFRVLVQGKQKAALIFPERTGHPENEIEVIAPVNLRKRFRLKQGSLVSLRAL